MYKKANFWNELEVRRETQRDTFEEHSHAVILNIC